MKKTIYVGLAMLLALASFLVSGRASASEKTITIENTYQLRSEDEKSAGKAIKETLKLKQNPKKVVVYDLGGLDTITALGKSSSVVAVPKAQNALNLMSANLKKIYKGNNYKDAGSLFEPNFETIAELQPDVIIIGGRSASAKNIEEFKKAAPKAAIIYGSVDTANGQLIAPVKERLALFGKLFKAEKKAKALAKKLDNSLKNVKTAIAKLEDKSALFVMANSGELLSQAPKGRFGWIFSDLGFKAVNSEETASRHGSQVSYEYLVEKNPNYLFVLDRGAAIGKDRSAEKLLSNDVIKDITAIKNKHVLQVNGKNWYINTGGVTTTLTMLKEVQTFITAK